MATAAARENRVEHIDTRAASDRSGVKAPPLLMSWMINFLFFALFTE